MGRRAGGQQDKLDKGERGGCLIRDRWMTCRSVVGAGKQWGGAGKAVARARRVTSEAGREQSKVTSGLGRTISRQDGNSVRLSSNDRLEMGVLTYILSFRF